MAIWSVSSRTRASIRAISASVSFNRARSGATSRLFRWRASASARLVSRVRDFGASAAAAARGSRLGGSRPAARDLLGRLGARGSRPCPPGGGVAALPAARLLFLPLLQVVVVIPRVLRQAPVADLDHLGGDPVDEVAVVGDEEHGAVELIQGLLQDLAGGDVQVVGRLVQAQEVRRPEQHLGQRQPALLAAGQDGHRLLHVVAREQEGAQDPPQARLHLQVGDRGQLLQHRVSGDSGHRADAARSSGPRRCAPGSGPPSRTTGRRPRS